MDIISDFLREILALLAFAALCIFLQLRFPSIKNQKTIRSDTRLDITYWLLNSSVFMLVIKLVVASLLTIFILFDSNIPNERGYWDEIPTAIKFLTALVAIDFIAYWVHRGFHRGRFWKIHSIHHSAREIDFLTTFRFHPVELMATLSAQFLFVIVVLGIGLDILAIAAIARSSYGYIVHANLRWTYGKLGYIIASPVFHRWHHTMEEEGLDKNFAGVFSGWDYLFGTAYENSQQQPHNFGVSEDIGQTYLQQLTYPFRK